MYYAYLDTPLTILRQAGGERERGRERDRDRETEIDTERQRQRDSHRQR